MTQIPKDSSLDVLLRQADPYLEDDGFTERVMARLPAPRSVPRARRFILAAAGALAAALALWVLLDLALAAPWGGALPGVGAPGSAGSGWLGSLADLWGAVALATQRALSWTPAPLPTAFPLVPLLLSLGAMAGALVHAHRRA